MLLEKEVTTTILRPELGICSACEIGTLEEEIVLKSDNSAESTGIFCCGKCNTSFPELSNKKTLTLEISHSIIAELMMRRYESVKHKEFKAFISETQTLY